MNTMNLKRSLWLAAILLTSLCAGAQTTTHSYLINNDQGKRTETVQTDYEGKAYKIEWINEKITDLAVDGKTIPQAEWPQYSAATGHIRQELKEQAKRNEAQAKRNAKQAVRNQEQARRNEAQAQLNAEQQKRNEEQVRRNQEQAKANAGQQRLNEQQAIRNQEQAQKNEVQAKAMEQLMKAITADLVRDRIIKDEHDLRQLSFNGHELYVNDIKQPEAITKKYYAQYSKEKYAILYDHFNYSRDGIIKGQ